MADAKTSATHNNTATTTAAVIHDTQASVAIAAHTIDTAANNSKMFFPRDYIFGQPILITRFPSRDSVDQKLDIEFKLTDINIDFNINKATCT